MFFSTYNFNGEINVSRLSLLKKKSIFLHAPPGNRPSTTIGTHIEKYRLMHYMLNLGLHAFWNVLIEGLLYE
jgi:hypothetical protein